MEHIALQSPVGGDERSDRQIQEAHSGPARREHSDALEQVEVEGRLHVDRLALHQPFLRVAAYRRHGEDVHAHEVLDAVDSEEPEAGFVRVEQTTFGIEDQDAFRRFAEYRPEEFLAAAAGILRPPPGRHIVEEDCQLAAQEAEDGVGRPELDAAVTVEELAKPLGPSGFRNPPQGFEESGVRQGREELSQGAADDLVRLDREYPPAGIVQRREPEVVEVMYRLEDRRSVRGAGEDLLVSLIDLLYGFRGRGGLGDGSRPRLGGGGTRLDDFPFGPVARCGCLHRFGRLLLRCAGDHEHVQPRNDADAHEPACTLGFPAVHPDADHPEAVAPLQACGPVGPQPAFVLRRHEVPDVHPQQGFPLLLQQAGRGRVRCHEAPRVVAEQDRVGGGIEDGSEERLALAQCLLSIPHTGDIPAYAQNGGHHAAVVVHGGKPRLLTAVALWVGEAHLLDDGVAGREHLFDRGPLLPGYVGREKVGTEHAHDLLDGHPDEFGG